MPTFTNTSTGKQGSAQFWTVPSTGKYRIQAWGASGAAGSGMPFGGKGAYVEGVFDLQEGLYLHILVGQMGTRFDEDEASGGGASAVGHHPGLDLLVVAGGGGGYSSKDTITSYATAHGRSIEFGRTAYSGNASRRGAGGSPGNGGGAGSTRGFGGGGWNNPGDGSGGGEALLGTPNPFNGLRSFGAIGGDGGREEGGFGSGGGLGSSTGWGSAGGGGGYGGGGGAYAASATDTEVAGGGGGSFVRSDATDTVLLDGGDVSRAHGHGLVIIEKVAGKTLTIQHRPQGYGFWSVISGLDPDTGMSLISNLDENTTYEFRARYQEGDNVSDWTPIVTATTETSTQHLERDFLVSGVGATTPQITTPHNLIPPFEQWTINGNGWIDSEGKLHLQGGSAHAWARIDEANNWRFFVDAYVEGTSPNQEPDGGTHWASTYYNEDRTATVQNLGGWTGNGNAQTMVPEADPVRLQWGQFGGPGIVWVLIQLNTDNAWGSPYAVYERPQFQASDDTVPIEVPWVTYAHYRELHAGRASTVSSTGTIHARRQGYLSRAAHLVSSGVLVAQRLGTWARRHTTTGTGDIQAERRGALSRIVTVAGQGPVLAERLASLARRVTVTGLGPTLYQRVGTWTRQATLTGTGAVLPQRLVSWVRSTTIVGTGESLYRRSGTFIRRLLIEGQGMTLTEKAMGALVIVVLQGQGIVTATRSLVAQRIINVVAPGLTRIQRNLTKGIQTLGYGVTSLRRTHRRLLSVASQGITHLTYNRGWTRQSLVTGVGQASTLIRRTYQRTFHVASSGSVLASQTIGRIRRYLVTGSVSLVVQRNVTKGIKTLGTGLTLLRRHSARSYRVIGPGVVHFDEYLKLLRQFIVVSIGSVKAKTWIVLTIRYVVEGLGILRLQRNITRRLITMGSGLLDLGLSRIRKVVQFVTSLLDDEGWTSTLYKESEPWSSRASYMLESMGWRSVTFKETVLWTSQLDREPWDSAESPYHPREKIE